MRQTELVVIGGGAAGLMAALTAAELGTKVTLIERNEKVGRKIYITGKGRCNLTNLCDVQDFLRQIPRGSRFLNSALFNFTPEATMNYFQSLGVPLKVERGNRVFPVSDRSSDVIDALFIELRRKGVSLVQAQALELDFEHGAAAGVKTDKGHIGCKAIVLATGGLSYPTTGSTGDGYEFAKQAGHEIIKCLPSLIPFASNDSCCAEMQGLSLKNVSLSIFCENKVVFQEQGELLFTHFGISGPLVLSASAIVENYSECFAVINTKPALSAQQLDERLLREFDGQKNRDIANVMATLLPRLMIEPVLRQAGIEANSKCHSMTRSQRQRLCTTLQSFRISIQGTRPIEEAVVTRGGVELTEVNSKTMESKLCKGLYLAGELLNIDGLTGGFNLQIAWSTGRAAGYHAAKELEECRF